MNQTSAEIRTYRDLQVYQGAFNLQQLLFRFSNNWPKDEAYSLIDQVRRSSRSIGAHLSHAWSKRRDPADFLSQLTDADGELQETRHWISTATACEYLSKPDQLELERLCGEVGGKLGAMMARHEKFCIRSEDTNRGSEEQPEPQDEAVSPRQRSAGGTGRFDRTSRFNPAPR